MSWVLKFLVAILFPLYTSLFSSMRYHMTIFYWRISQLSQLQCQVHLSERLGGGLVSQTGGAKLLPWTHGYHVSHHCPLQSSPDWASFTSISGGRRKPFRSCLWKTWRGTVVIFLRPSVGFLSHRGYQMNPNDTKIIQHHWKWIMFEWGNQWFGVHRYT